MSDLQRNEIHLWLVEDQLISDPCLLQSYRALLNKEESQRYERLIFPQHKKQFLVSRALVRSVLATYLDTAPQELGFARNAYGKPRISDPDTGKALNFNLSHTNELSVLAICREDDIGVDVEYLTRKVDILNLAQRYFSWQETEALQALAVNQFNERFFDLWTLKEAYIKACGMGLAIPLQDFTFSFTGTGLQISFSEDRQDTPQDWQFWLFKYRQVFKLALALRQIQGRVEKNIKIQAGVPLQGFDSCALELEMTSD